MKKMNRKERRAEERRIIAEMDSAMQAKKEEKPKTVDFASGEQTKVYGKEAPEILHCRRCRSVMEKGVCPECGYKIFVPMDESKRKKIRWISTAIGLVIFAIVFAVVKATQ